MILTQKLDYLNRQIYGSKSEALDHPEVCRSRSLAGDAMKVLLKPEALDFADRQSSQNSK